MIVSSIPTKITFATKSAKSPEAIDKVEHEVLSHEEASGYAA